MVVMAELALLMLFLIALGNTDATLSSGVACAVVSASKLDGAVKDAASWEGMASRWQLSSDPVLVWSRSNRKGRFRSSPWDDGVPVTGVDLWHAGDLTVPDGDGVLACSNLGTIVSDGGAHGSDDCKYRGKNDCRNQPGLPEMRADLLTSGPSIPVVGIMVWLCSLEKITSDADVAWCSDGLYHVGGGGLLVGRDGVRVRWGGSLGVPLAISAWALCGLLCFVGSTQGWVWVGCGFCFRIWAAFGKGVDGDPSPFTPIIV